MSDESPDEPEHLGRKQKTIYWDWTGENPVEIILVTFILVLLFTLPRTGCQIDKTKGNMPHSTSQVTLE